MAQKIFKEKMFLIFRAAVDGMLPQKRMSNYIGIENSKLSIKDKTFDLDTNVHVIGFGKAVAGMALALQDVIGPHLVSGMLSVPRNSFDYQSTQKNIGLSDRIIVMEGARNNLPDEAAVKNAQHILDYVSALKKKDILFVLISGGGSALLPAPLAPVSLKEKNQVIKHLTSKGATIQELNTVRKRLSLVKGGGLASFISTNNIISLIISDIIDDPIDLIASGPTVLNKDPPEAALDVIKKYELFDVVPKNAIYAMNKPPMRFNENKFSLVQNVIIGSNFTGLEAALTRAEKMGFASYILTGKVSGNVNKVGQAFGRLAGYIEQAYASDSLILAQMRPIFEILNIPIEKMDYLMIKIRTARMKNMNLCLIFGGETTVEVTGKGLGGRNQQLALVTALELALYPTRAMFLSAGSDGIDGPTDAAGAYAYSAMIQQAKAESLDVKNYLKENNSYVFYQKYNEGEDLLFTGHTGTNCMDIMLLCFDWNPK